MITNFCHYQSNGVLIEIKMNQLLSSLGQVLVRHGPDGGRRPVPGRLLPDPARVQQILFRNSRQLKLQRGPRPNQRLRWR